MAPFLLIMLRISMAIRLRLPGPDESIDRSMDGCMDVSYNQIAWDLNSFLLGFDVMMKVPERERYQVH